MSVEDEMKRIEEEKQRVLAESKAEKARQLELRRSAWEENAIVVRQFVEKFGLVDLVREGVQLKMDEVGSSGTPEVEVHERQFEEDPDEYEPFQITISSSFEYFVRERHMRWYLGLKVDRSNNVTAHSLGHGSIRRIACTLPVERARVSTKEMLKHQKKLRRGGIELAITEFEFVDKDDETIKVELEKAVAKTVLEGKSDWLNEPAPEKTPLQGPRSDPIN